MYRSNDPRFRRTLNTISHNLETANETAQENLYSTYYHCLLPCIESVTVCFDSTKAQCFPSSSRGAGREEQLHRGARRRPQGRVEHSFDFYDDWEEDENEALLAWGNDEYERQVDNNEDALPGRNEPSRRRFMSYGTGGGSGSGVGGGTKRGGRRRSVPYDERDLNLLPNQSYFGFLDRLPFRLGGTRWLRYKPSAAGLQDRVRDESFTAAADGRKGVAQRHSAADDTSGASVARRSGRLRSFTSGSEETEDSYSSRGDIFPSDEEDAVVLDDDDMMGFDLERRGSRGQPVADDNDSRRASGPNSGQGKKRNRKRQNLNRTPSTKSIRSILSTQSDEVQKASLEVVEATDPREIQETDNQDYGTSLAELKREEQQMQVREENDLQRKREAAHILAREQGLSVAYEASNLSDATPAATDAHDQPAPPKFLSHDRKESHDEPP